MALESGIYSGLQGAGSLDPRATQEQLLLGVGIAAAPSSRSMAVIAISYLGGER